MKSLCTILTHKLQDRGILPDDHETLAAAVTEAMHEIAMGLAVGEIQLAPVSEQVEEASDPESARVASTVKSLTKFLDA